MAATLKLPIDNTLTIADLAELLRRCAVAQITPDTHVTIGGLSPKTKTDNLHISIPVNVTRTILR